MVKHSSSARQNIINKKLARKRKVIFRSKSFLPPYTFIVCEGVKTEPNYIKGLADKINEKFYNFSQGKRIIVEGVGRNTKGLLQYAAERVEKVMPQAEVVWLLYDKDDFPADDFDNTQFSAESRRGKRQYRCAWSNECFELWLVLHFQELRTNNGRYHLIELLKKHLGKYEKNTPEIYNLLSNKTDIAIKRAKNLISKYPANTPPSKMCPATTVFKLVEELKKYAG